MSRYKDFREPRSRGFDDDFAPAFKGSTPPRSSAPPRSNFAPTPSGPEAEAVVSWFNGEKGFGFVKLSDGSGDAFLHAKVLEGAGHTSVEPGATLVVRTGQGQKGMQVTQVVSVDTSTAAPAAARPPRPAGPRMGAGGGGGAPRAEGPTTDGMGTVKWYDPTKGFGFITLDGGTKDAFVHATALERSGLANLAEGQRVNVQVAQGQKGPEVRSLKPA